jgi:hypothetical protein
MPWPQHVLEQFGTVTRGNIDESEYYGPYIGLLLELFPGQSNFMVVPKHKHCPGFEYQPSIVFIVQQLDKHPVFFIEIRPSSHKNSILERADTDEQMREQLKALAEEVIIDTLYGISAFGTDFCVFSFNRATRAETPAQIYRSRTIVHDSAPSDRWKLNLLTEEGEARFREVVGEIHQMCTTL